MTTLIVGASGATGRLLVKHLLKKKQRVKIIVRSTNNLPKEVLSHENLSIILGSILDFSDSEMEKHIAGCEAIVSCLGHNLTLKGLFGHPRKLVTDATKKLCMATKKTSPKKPVKFVLMNTTGNSNRDLDEPISFAQKCVIGILRLLLPPHVDNEKAADYLRTDIGQNDSEIQWAVVRPDGLIDEVEVTLYTIHQSPIRSAIFDAGKTSRINVGHFIADLISNSELWSKWQGKMPVIYNMDSNP